MCGSCGDMTTGTYVYCVIAADRKPVLRRRYTRLPGMGPVRLLDVGRGLWMAVADAPLNQYGEDTINRKLSDLDWVSRAAVGHEAVVESFIEQRAVLPMKLFTIFTRDDRALEQVRGDRRRVDALVKRVANHDEWGVRVTLGHASPATPPEGPVNLPNPRPNPLRNPHPNHYPRRPPGRSRLPDVVASPRSGRDTHRSKY